MAEELNILEIQQIADLFANALKDKLADNNSNATGNLSRSIRSIVKFDGKWLEINVNLQDYWIYVEKGRKAGRRPPISAIKQWVQVKPIVPYTKGKRVPTTNDLAYLIARSIGNKGIKPKPFFEVTKREFGLVEKVENILVGEFSRISDDLLLEINDFKIES